MSDRRYDDDEVARILARASEASAEEAALARPEGLSLAELQAIGREAGIPPERIAAAARALDRPTPPAPSLLGLTLGVGDATQLDRRIGDAEWERLVVLLRETFDARGQVQVTGNLRQWTNGNLHVFVEPGSTGDRVRLRTRNAAAQALLSIGASFLTSAAVVAGIAIATGRTGEAGLIAPLVPMVGLGIGSAIAGLLRLRRWAPTRLAQMRRVVERLEAGSL